MKTRVQKWGNSLAVRIPKSFAEDVGIYSESEVQLSLVEGQLVITPIVKAEPIYRLEDLLAGITEDNLHGEIDFGASVGDEVW